MQLKEIGIIHSPYDREGKNKPPMQGLDKVESTIEVHKEYEDGLTSLKDGDRILVLYWADLASRTKLISDFVGHGAGKGVFSIRSPHRPNPILVSKASIVERDGNILKVRGLEAIDGSSLLDIKIDID